MLYKHETIAAAGYKEAMEEALNKEKIAQCFLRGQATYDTHALVQKKVSQKLIGLLDSYPEIDYERVLEIGCCTGTLTRDLLDYHTPGLLYINDLVSEFYPVVLERTHERFHSGIEPFFGDIEELFLPQDLGLVISSSTFQWLINLPPFFKEVATSLSDGGAFVFSLFSPGTLKEFKSLTGIGLEYRSLEEIERSLKADFNIKYTESRTDVSYFKTPRDVLRHLQATGVGGVSSARWTSSSLRKFEKEYVEKFSTEKGVPVSFVSSYVVAFKK